MHLFRCLLTAGLATVAASARAEQFKYLYRPGQQVRSRANLAGAMMMGQAPAALMKAQFRMSLRQTQRVVSVSGGIVTLEITDVPLSGKMIAGGRTESYGSRTPTRYLVRMTERGRFLSRKALTAEESSAQMSGMDGADALYGLNFPNRDLKAGDVWEDTVTVGTGASLRKVHMRCRYVGRETFRGRSCARFSTVLSMPSGGDAAGGMGVPGSQGRMTGTVTTYFDPKAGLEVYSNGSLVVVERADLTGISPDAGELVNVSKINVVQALTPGAAGRK
jgi:hypothetical protein